MRIVFLKCEINKIILLNIQTKGKRNLNKLPLHNFDQNEKKFCYKLNKWGRGLLLFG